MLPFQKTIIAIVIILAFGFSQNACCQRDSTKFDHLFGVAPSFNQLRASYICSCTKRFSFYAEAGYQFRYISGYDRFSSLQVGILPMLASRGPVAEIGMSGVLKKSSISVGILYKLNFIEDGYDSYLSWVDGISHEELYYSRVDHHAVIKGLWVFNLNKIVQPYFGLGFKTVLSDYTITSSSLLRPDPAARLWFSPTMHLGVKFYPLRIISST